MKHIETAIRFLKRPAILSALAFLFLGFMVQNLHAQNSSPMIRFDDNTRVFRIDAADTTYVLGVNENQQVQTLYWGKRLSTSDRFEAAKAMPPAAAFDLSITT